VRAECSLSLGPRLVGVGPRGPHRNGLRRARPSCLRVAPGCKARGAGACTCRTLRIELVFAARCVRRRRPRTSAIDRGDIAGALWRRRHVRNRDDVHRASFCLRRSLPHNQCCLRLRTPTSRFTVYPSATLELRGATFDGESYERTAQTDVPYLFARGVRLGRVVYALEDIPSAASGRLHVFLQLADNLGSTSTVVDKDSGEQVVLSDGEMEVVARVLRLSHGSWEARSNWKFTDVLPFRA
jgi:hypothetical protein